MNVPRPHIRPNGKPGEFELRWSPIELAFGSAILALLAWLSLGQIAVGKQVVQSEGSIRTEIEILKTEAAARAKEHDHFLTREEFRLYNEGRNRR